MNASLFNVPGWVLAREEEYGVPRWYVIGPDGEEGPRRTDYLKALHDIPQQHRAAFQRGGAANADTYGGTQ